MVMLARMFIWPFTLSGTLGTGNAERVVLPPVAVEGTDHACLSTALFQSFRKHVFGRDLKDAVLWLRNNCALTIFVFVHDSASANLLALSLMRALLLLQADAHMTLAPIMVCLERCSLHQVGRVSGDLLAKYKLKAGLYCMGKLFTLKRNRNTLKTAIRKVVAAMSWEVGAVGSTSISGSPIFRSALKNLLMFRWSDPADEKASSLQVAFQEFFDFWNGDPTASPTHFCNGCHSSKQAAIDDGTKKTLALLELSNLDFMPSRWMGQNSATLFWGRLELTGRIASSAFRRIVVSKDESAADRVDAG